MVIRVEVGGIQTAVEVGAGDFDFLNVSSFFIFVHIVHHIYNEFLLK